MDNIKELSSTVNWTFNSNKQNTCIDAMLSLYQSVQRGGGRQLLNLPASDCQCVGLAFTCMALFFDNGDKDINSVAAENAYYCLAKTYIGSNNSYALPAVFTLLQRKPFLLYDKFIANWCTFAQKEAGMPIGMMLGGNPFRDPKLQDFRNQAVGFIEQVKYYVLNIFYNVDNSTFNMPTDLPYHLPNQAEIKTFLSAIGKNENFSYSEYFSIGKKHFEGVFKECENTLKEF